MGTLALTRKGDLLRLTLMNRIGDLRSLPQLVTSAQQVGRLGVLLAQTIPYGIKAVGLSPLVPDIEAILPMIKQLSLPRAEAHTTKSGEDGRSDGEPRRRIRWAGLALSLRLRLPSDFADGLLELSAELRSRALWLALNQEVAESFDFQKLIASEGRVRQAGKLLNQALAKAGKDNDLMELVPATQEVLAILASLRKPGLGGGVR